MTVFRQAFGNELGLIEAKFKRAARRHKFWIDSVCRIVYTIVYMKRISLFVTEKQDAQIKEIADRDNVSTAEMYRRAVDEFLNGNVHKRIEELKAELASITRRVEKLETRSKHE